MLVVREDWSWLAEFSRFATAVWTTSSRFLMKASARTVAIIAETMRTTSSGKRRRNGRRVGGSQETGNGTP
jgi:hypothetical protein